MKLELRSGDTRAQCACSHYYCPACAMEPEESRAREADAICRALADYCPVRYEEWIHSIKGSGFVCAVCGMVTSERSDGFNAQDEQTAKHQEKCAYARAVAYCKAGGQ